MSADEFDVGAADDGLETLSRVDRSVPNQPQSVTGQSPKCEVFVVSDEAVEKAARALAACDGRAWAGRADDDEHVVWRDDVRAALVAALPVIERDLRETPRGIPLYAMLDVWMALGGEPEAFDRMCDEDRRTTADTWSQITALVRGDFDMLARDTNPPTGPEFDCLIAARVREGGRA